MKKLALLFVVLIFLPACTSTKHARLYPFNELASQTGVLQAEYLDSGMGGGQVTITMPDGEILNGEYSTVDNSTVGFGSIYTSVYGTGGSAFGSGSATSFSVPGSSPGIASFYGTNGTMMQCEYFVSRSGKGGGACKSADGALYRLHF
jgi:hypothetical protein